MNKQEIINIAVNNLKREINEENLWNLTLEGWYADNNKLALLGGQLLLNIYPKNNNILNNIEYYVKKIKAKQVLEIKEKIEGLNPMNTSFGYYKNMIIAFVRTVNYKIEEGNYLAGEDGSYSSITWLLLLGKESEEMVIRKKYKIENQNERWFKGEAIYGGGYEDIRVYPYPFESNNEKTKWYFTGLRYLNEGIKQYIGVISFDGEKAKIEKAEKINYGGYCEKNWIISEFNETNIKIIYKYYPLTTLLIENNKYQYEIINEKISYETGISSKIKYDYSNLRGGTCPIKIKNYKIAIVHECRINNKRCYFNRFIMLNDENYIIGVSDAFKFTENKIEYIAGLILDSNETELYISVGIDDKETNIMILDVKEVIKMIKSPQYRYGKFINKLYKY